MLLHFALKQIRRIPNLKQQALVTVTPDEVKVEDLNSRKSRTLRRKDSHPRSLTGDWHILCDDAERALASVFARKWLGYEVVVKMVGLDDGGYTSVEVRAIREAMWVANAKEIYIAGSDIEKEMAKEALDESL